MNFNKKITSHFIFGLTLFLLSHLALATNDLSIKCDSSSETEQACIKKFQRRLVIADTLRKNYDPNMLRMLKVNAFAGQLIDQVDALKDNSEAKKFIFKEAIKLANHLGSELSSIKTDEIPDYLLGIVGKSLEEGVDLAAGLGDLLPAKFTPASLAGKVLLKAAPGIIEISKKSYSEFPKIKVGNVDDAIAAEENMADLFRLTTVIEEGHALGEISSEAFRVMNVAFATFTGQTIHVSEDKIARSEASQVLAGFSELLTYSEEGIKINIEAAKNQVIKEARESMDKTEKKLSSQLGNLKEQNQQLLKGQRQTQQKVDDVMEGVGELKTGQNHIIKGVDYLTQAEISKEVAKELSEKDTDKLRAYVADLQKGLKNKSVQDHCKIKSETLSLEQKKCAVQATNLSRAEKLLDQSIYNDRMQLAGSTVGVLSDLGNIFGDKKLTSVANEANRLITTVTKVNNAIDSFSKLSQAASLLTNMAGFMTGVGAISSAMSLFSGGSDGGQAAVNQQILAELKAIRESIQNLHEDMLDEFEKTQNQIELLGDNLNYSIKMQTAILSSQIAFQSELASQNHEEIIEELKNLREVNLNIEKLFNKETIREFKVVSKDYSGTKNQDAISQNFITVISRYSTAIEEVKPKSEQGFPIINHVIAESALFDAQDMILLTQTNKLGANGKYLLLNLAMNLVNSIGEAKPGCDDAFFSSVFYANLLSHDLITLLKSSFERDGQTFSRAQLVIQDQENVDTRFLSRQLKGSVELLKSLQTRAETCLGLGGKEGSNLEATQGSTFIKNLSQFYYENFLSHINSTQEKLRQEGGRIRTAILNGLKKDANFSVGPTEVFNGFLPHLKPAINDSFVMNAPTAKDFLTDNFAYKNFISRSRGKIGRCFSEKNYEGEMSTMDYPTETIHAILKDPHLKIAEGAGLIQWTWCFELGPYDITKREKTIYLVAKSGDGKPESSPVQSIWKVLLPVPANLSEQAANKYKKTVSQWKRKTNPWDLQDKSSTQSSFVANCSASVQEEKGYYLVRDFSASPNLEDSPFEGGDNYRNEYGVIKQTRVTCEKLQNVLIGLWSPSLVASSGAWNYTRKNSSACASFDESVLTHRCVPSSAVTTPKKDYQTKVEDFFEQPVFDLGKMENIYASDPGPAKDLDQKKAVIERGVKRFYLLVKFALENCESRALKGLGSCSPINSEILLPPPQLDLTSLSVASDMLVHMPLTFYTPATKTPEGNQNLSEKLSYVLSPFSVLSAAEAYNSFTGEGTSLAETAKEVLLENQKQFEQEVIPLLGSDYKFDDSILVHDEIFSELGSFIRRLEEAH